MSAGDWFYVAQSINPVGGLLASVPWAILKLHYPLWVVLLSGPPLAYIQVIVVDLSWSYLRRISYINNLLEKKHSPRVERLFASGGAFLPVLIATPLVGPWVVMLVMRYAKVSQRQVFAPIALALTLVTGVLSILCLSLPDLFG